MEAYGSIRTAGLGRNSMYIVTLGLLGCKPIGCAVRRARRRQQRNIELASVTKRRLDPCAVGRTDADGTVAAIDRSNTHRF